MSQIVGLKVIVDAGEVMVGDLEIRTETEAIYSEHATKPDPQWRYVDRAGHFHSWARGDTYPTLVTVSRHVPCDGACGGVCGGEGWTQATRHCRICAEEIDPGQVDDSGVHHITTGRSWSVTVRGLVGMAATGTIVVRPPGMEEKVTVRAFDAERGITWFGIAAVGEVEASFSTTGMSGATTKLYGIGELGEFSEPVPARQAAT